MLVDDTVLILKQLISWRLNWTDQIHTWQTFLDLDLSWNSCNCTGEWTLTKVGLHGKEEVGRSVCGKIHRCIIGIVHCPFSMLICHGSSVLFILSCQPYRLTAMVNYSLLFAGWFWLSPAVLCVCWCNKCTCFIWAFNEGWLKNNQFISIMFRMPYTASCSSVQVWVYIYIMMYLCYLSRTECWKG